MLDAEMVRHTRINCIGHFSPVAVNISATGNAPSRVKRQEEPKSDRFSSERHIPEAPRLLARRNDDRSTVR